MTTMVPAPRMPTDPPLRRPQLTPDEREVLIGQLPPTWELFAPLFDGSGDDPHWLGLVDMLLVEVAQRQRDEAER